MGDAPNCMVDWDDLPRWVASLDDTQRSLLSDALRKADSAGNERSVVDTVRDVLAREEPDRVAVAVVFADRMEYENGVFLESGGTVLFADGTVDELTFDYVNETFTEEWGVVGPSFGVSVDLRTGDVDFDDYADNLFESLGFPAQQ